MLYFIVRGSPHPFDHPNHQVEIVAWEWADTALEAASRVAERLRGDDVEDYTAFCWNGEVKRVAWVPGEGVDPDPPTVAIG